MSLVAELYTAEVIRRRKMLQKYITCEVCGDEVAINRAIKVDEDIYTCGFECEKTYNDEKLKKELEKEDGS